MVSWRAEQAMSGKRPSAVWTARGRRFAPTVALVLLLGAILAASSPAEDTSAPPFLLAFGGEGAAAGQFELARGVAVDRVSGDVYVADQANQRVQEFSPWGMFIAMFGGHVDATTSGDICTAESKDSCQAGTGGTAGAEFKSPQGVAVDNGESSSSRGDVYVVDHNNQRVEKFTPTGEFLLTFGKEVNETKDKEAGATEAERNVCTAESKDACRAGKAGIGEDEVEWPFFGSYIAVGNTGTVYVGDENRIQEFAPTGQHVGEINLSGVGDIKAMALDSREDVYVSSLERPGVHEYNATGGQITEFDPESETVEAVALDPANDLFVGERREGRVQISEYSPSGTQVASFGSEGLGTESESTGLAANATGTVYVSELTTPYRVVVYGKPPPGEPPPVAPSIDSQLATSLGITEAVVSAEIDPHFLETSYRVQYVAAASYKPEETDPYADGGEIPAAPGTVLGGGEVQSDQAASVTLPGLTPGTTYDYRFVAQSKGGATFGADQTFTTFSPGGISGLPDERAYEQVSSLEPNGNEAGIGVFVDGEYAPTYGVSTAGGERVVYLQRGPSGETHSGHDLYSVSTRDPQTGWGVAAVLPSGCGVNAASVFGEEAKALLPSADLSHFVFQALGGFGAGNCPQPTNEDPVASNGALYRTATGAAEPEWWLSKPTIKEGEEPGPTPNPIKSELLLPVGGSPNLETVYFTYFGTLVPQDALRAPHVHKTGGGSEEPWGFYEWNGGVLSSAGELPNEPGEPAKGAPDEYGAVPAATRKEPDVPAPSPGQLDNEVSKEGSKAFFVSPDPQFAVAAGTPTELYAREHDGGAAATVLISRDELKGREPAPGAGAQEAVVPVRSSYVFASPDGSRAFFASNDQLTSAAPPGSAVKEYEFNLDTNGLTYMEKFTEPLSPPFSTILASSQDGSSFIFENTAERKLQLWERSPDGREQVSNLAVFSTPTSPRFEARAVSDGAATVFVVRTDAVLNPGSFDNDAATQQVYRYVTGGKLTCLSCAPDGTAQSSTQPFGWSRVVADEGARVFFGSAEPLLARAINGVENIYEWAQAGTGSCQSEEREGGCIYLISTGTSPNQSLLIDNSESGDDVFFATSQALVKGDSGESYAIFDARASHVPGEVVGFPQETPPAECTGGGCRQAGPPPPLAGPLTTALGPSGNLTAPLEARPPTAKPEPKPLTRAQKLASALKACRKKPRKKRAACERQARGQYGARATAKRAQRSPGRRA